MKKENRRQFFGSLLGAAAGATSLLGNVGPRESLSDTVEADLIVVNGNVLTVTIARAIYRDRTRSVPDILTGGHGDAAFANWVWLASYTFPAGGKHRASPDDNTRSTPTHSDPAPAAASSSRGNGVLLANRDASAYVSQTECEP